MSKKFDDEAAAIEDIATSPDVTEGVEENIEELTGAAKAEEQAARSDEKSEKYARVMAKSISKTYKNIVGEPFDDDQKEAMSEIGTILFEAMQSKRWLLIPTLVFTFALPFIPAALKLANSFGENKKSENLKEGAA